MDVVALYRYPVKSVTGEEVEQAEVDERGLAGDRVWSVRTERGKIGSGKNTRRFEAVRGLLEIRSTWREGRVMVGLPDDSWWWVDSPDAAEAVSRHLGRAVTLARETDVDHFDDGPVSIVGRASVEALAAERGEEVESLRFRPNIVAATREPFEEDSWVGRDIQIGSAVLTVTMASVRCVMVDMETADLPEQHGNLSAIGRLHDACLGVIATVRSPGRITRGDPVAVR